MEKSDVIILTGKDSAKIDAIATYLLKYFSDHQYISRVELLRIGVPAEKLIADAVTQNRYLILNVALDVPLSLNAFKVLVGGTKNDSAVDQYDLMLPTDGSLIDSELASKIVVGQGCWLQGRKVTQPI